MSLQHSNIQETCNWFVDEELSYIMTVSGVTDKGASHLLGS